MPDLPVFYNSVLARKLKFGGLWCGTIVLAAASFFGMLAGCEAQRRKSDAELGLTPNQASGRAIFDRQCGGCHEAYSSRPLKGPALEGLFKRKYMKNGMPASEERIREIVTYGRAKMPAFNRALTPEQVDRIMDYLRTL